MTGGSGSRSGHFCLGREEILTIPTRPVFGGTGKLCKPGRSLAGIPALVKGEVEESFRSVRITVESKPSIPGAVRRMDQIDTCSRHTYLPRYTVDKMIDVPVTGEEE